MNKFQEAGGRSPISHAYKGRTAPIMACGLPCDEMCRGLHRARALRNAWLMAYIACRSRQLLGAIPIAVTQ